MIENGLSDIIQDLKRYNYDVKETNPEDNVSDKAGFRAVKDGVIIHYDGNLYINNEPVQTPWGDFDPTIGEHVHWFLENVHVITKPMRSASKEKHSLANRPEDRVENFDGD